MRRNDLHALYATAVTPEGHVPFRVGQPTDWGRAMARWTRLDDARIAGKQPTVRHDGRSYPVATFEVRATDRHGRGLGSERHERALTVAYRACKVSR